MEKKEVNIRDYMMVRRLRQAYVDVKLCSTNVFSHEKAFHSMISDRGDQKKKVVPLWREGSGVGKRRSRDDPSPSEFGITST